MAARRPAEVFPPGDFLREELEARGWTVSDLAEILGRPASTLNEVINGKRGITPETARGLAEAFGTSAEYWMRLDTYYQLYRKTTEGDGVARRAKLYSRAPIRHMVKRGWIEPSDDIETLEMRVLRFLNIESLDAAPSFRTAARMSASYVSIAPPQEAWLARAGQLAHAVQVGSFSKDKVDAALYQLALLTHEPREVRHVPRILSEAGIRFVIVEPLPESKIDGASFWLASDAPVVALSLRFGRIDSFWFTLLHEIGHIVNGDQSVDDDLLEAARSDSGRPERERLADQFASENLIPQKQIEGFIARVRPVYSTRRILGFAETVHVHPGIVVGQLQHRREISWANFRGMLVSVREWVTGSAMTDGWGTAVPAL
jgi:HTH-type transcriptional regulator / antitoxin HigA